MLKLAVVGKDVSHSDSPAIHNFILGKWGVKCSYEKVSVPPAEFSSRAEGLFSSYDAFNVTIPFKAEIVPFLKELRGDAGKFGAVNTVLCGSREGYSTDGFGFSMMLRGAGVSLSGKRVLLLGAGGAGRSCIEALKAEGAELCVYERDEERLFTAYRTLGGFAPCTEVPLREYELIVNCTGVGMHDTVGRTPVVLLSDGSAEPAGKRLVSYCSVAADLIYVPAQSEFLHAASLLGKKTVNGASMLFYQAYLTDCIICKREARADEAQKLYEEFGGNK